MMERRVRLQLEIVSVLLLALTGPAWAQAGPAFNVTGLRTNTVTLYRVALNEECKADPTAQLTVSRGEFQGPWAATQDKSPLFLRVSRNNEVYCVKAFSVQTDKTVRVEKDAECGAKVAGRPPKSAAVRGVGEGCRP